ncbi:uncharacterized protein LOC124131372 isoform X1 [Haliotis rufescens]|uniref:uncharacterized protein LOC124131372 isoform X1 n=1 Tax=Haliotis rufescens TaxID=6454 RepID=UPI001EAF9D71|nr:uncharacterized protein LOC124131372 isoform X1 [Haliotis rufescens]
MLYGQLSGDRLAHAVILQKMMNRIMAVVVLEFLTCFLICVGNASPEIRVREPQFTTMSGSINHKKGDLAILYCSVQNLGERTVVWRKLPMAGPLTVGTKTWVKDKRIHVEHMPNSDQWNLIIEKAKVNDSATYECQVSFRSKKLRQLITLTVKDDSHKDAPTLSISGIQISGESYLKKGQTLKLTCNASLIDESMDGLCWYKDKDILTTQGDKRIQVLSSVMLSRTSNGHMSSVLEITDTTASDSGNYVCKSPENSQMAGVRVEISNGSHNIKRVPPDPVESMDMKSSPNKKKHVSGCSHRVLSDSYLLSTTLITAIVTLVMK